MLRRTFLRTAIGAALAQAGAFASPRSGASTERPSPLSHSAPGSEGSTQVEASPMALGWIIAPAYHDPEPAIARLKELGISYCFLSLDDWIGRFSESGAKALSGLLSKYGVTPTCVEIVGPGRLVWDFLDGPSTIGLVPRATRAARIDALKQTSDFARSMGIKQVQTHCGFLPENPRDPLFPEAVAAIHEVATHCAANGQDFLMETGQETPTTMLRTIDEVNLPNLGVGLDTANLILYGKANPSDAADIIGPHVRSVHAKDGLWPTDPMKLGKEVLIGKGRVDFEQVFTKLRKLGYRNTITIEREISGPQQLQDVKDEKAYLERVIAKVQAD